MRFLVKQLKVSALRIVASHNQKIQRFFCIVVMVLFLMCTSNEGAVVFLNDSLQDGAVAVLLGTTTAIDNTTMQFGHAARGHDTRTGRGQAMQQGQQRTHARVARGLDFTGDFRVIVGSIIRSMRTAAVVVVTDAALLLLFPKMGKKVRIDENKLKEQEVIGSFTINSAQEVSLSIYKSCNVMSLSPFRNSRLRY